MKDRLGPPREPLLEAISKTTGAHYYDASDPVTVEQVLGDLVTNF